MAWKNPWFNAQKAHHRIDGFVNLDPAAGHRPGDLDKWRAERKQAKLPHPPAAGYDAFISTWWQRADFSTEEDGIWWLGHASVLARLNGINILIDPVFSQRASPVSFAGPSRKTPPCTSVAELPPVGAVVISHNHYDHLDSTVISQLKRYHPQACYFVPLGLGNWFMRRGIQQVIELDWMQSYVWQGLVLTAVPAQHWSMRTPWNRNRSLWCGWVLESDDCRFWFSGDTGYFPQLSDFVLRVGQPDMVALPVGAYAPEWFMHPHHMSPEESVSVWQQIGRPYAIPIHWGVFELADESIDEPPDKLLQALKNKGEDSKYFQCCRIGQYHELIKNNI